MISSLFALNNPSNNGDSAFISFNDSSLFIISGLVIL